MALTKLGPWAWPTLLGPFLPGWALVTWAAVVGDEQSVGSAVQSVMPFFDVDGWALAMFLVSMMSAVVAFHLVVVDVLLLRMRLRALPTGGRAWFSGLLAPIATVLAWVVLPSGDGGAGSVLTVALGFLLGALVVRLLLGKRPTA